MSLARNASWVKFKMATATKAGECFSLFYYLTKKSKLEGTIIIAHQ